MNEKLKPKVEEPVNKLPTTAPVVAKALPLKVATGVEALNIAADDDENAVTVPSSTRIVKTIPKPAKKLP